MTPERYAQIKQVFLEACARAPAERSRYLADRCGADTELHAEVEALLAVHTEAAPRAATAPARHEAGTRASHGGVARLDVQRDFQPGTVVAGRFRIVAPLGRGGMGDVYRADDLTLDQPVALKFLPVEFAADAQWLARLRDEVRLARTITHPGVCRVYDINEAAGDHFITMEYVDGENLKALLGQIGRLASDKAADLARQLCAALAAAHARGVLHRDLKPANIMLDREGRIRIMDFGLAALHDQVRPEEIRAGTPAYMAPEQFTGAGVSVRSDIYSLGLVLYELFTGQPALDPGASAQVRARSRAASPSRLVPDIDPAIERAILCCLEPDPADRPASVLELAAALPEGDALRLAQELGETPTPTLVAAAGHSQVSRRKTTALLVICGVLLAAVVALGPRVHPLGQVGAPKAPAVLAEKAREHLMAGGVTLAQCEAYGLTGGLAPSAEPAPLIASAPFRADPSEVLFWYRNSPTPLVPRDAERLVFGGAGVALEDPPLVGPGEAAIVLDAVGTLRAAQIVPRPNAERVATPDWNAWHARAGLDPALLTTTAPGAELPMLADGRWAWHAAATGAAPRGLRVEAAAYGGQPVWYAVYRTEPTATVLADLARRQTLVTVVGTLVLGALLIVAVPLTRVQVRQGRGDLRGATRLALCVFVAAVLAALLHAAHSTDAVQELRLLTLLLAGALGRAGVVWLFYLALEPIARRLWPQLLVSWARVLGGRWRDPLVGHDLLLGAVVGVAGCLLFQLDVLVTTGLSLAPRPHILVPDFFAASLSLRDAVAHAIDALRMGVYIALWFLLAVALARHVLRRATLAGIAVVLLTAIHLVPRGSHPVVSSIILALGVGGGLVCVTMRYGLVPVAVGVALLMVLTRLPLTFDLHAWYADGAVLAVLLTAAVAIYGYIVARGPAGVARLPSR